MRPGCDTRLSMEYKRLFEWDLGATPELNSKQDADWMRHGCDT
jgi:hypothetical protein